MPATYIFLDKCNCHRMKLKHLVYLTAVQRNVKVVINNVLIIARGGFIDRLISNCHF